MALFPIRLMMPTALGKEFHLRSSALRVLPDRPVCLRGLPAHMARRTGLVTTDSHAGSQQKASILLLPLPSTWNILTSAQIPALLPGRFSRYPHRDTLPPVFPAPASPATLEPVAVLFSLPYCV